MKRAGIYIESFQQLPESFRQLPAEVVARFGEPKAKPLEIQERACRAYCERMGYSVFGVYRAIKPAPKHVHKQLRWIISIDGNTLKKKAELTSDDTHFAYLYHDSHPYCFVRDKLELGDIDVIIEFREQGPSGPMFADAIDFEELPNNLRALEYASLWEIEPPSEIERKMYELVGAISTAETEEEISLLTTQLDALARLKSAEQDNTQKLQTEEEPIKLCFICRERPAREGSAFCSIKCALAAAENLVVTTGQKWCDQCKTWVGPDGCEHQEKA